MQAYIRYHLNFFTYLAHFPPLFASPVIAEMISRRENATVQMKSILRHLELNDSQAAALALKIYKEFNDVSNVN